MIINKTRPICHNRPMYPCGGIIGSDEISENHWRCEICQHETHDIKCTEVD